MEIRDDQIARATLRVVKHIVERQARHATSPDAALEMLRDVLDLYEIKADGMLSEVAHQLGLEPEAS